MDAPGAVGVPVGGDAGAHLSTSALLLWDPARFTGAAWHQHDTGRENVLLWQSPRRAASVVAWATVLCHTYGEALRLDAVGLYLFTASSLQQKHSKTSPLGQVVPITLKLLAVQSCRHSSTLLTSVLWIDERGHRPDQLPTSAISTRRPRIHVYSNGGRGC